MGQVLLPKLVKMVVHGDKVFRRGAIWRGVFHYWSKRHIEMLTTTSEYGYIEIIRGVKACQPLRRTIALC